MFSWTAQMPSSELASLPLVQHVAALAVVEALLSFPQVRELADVRIKWPNDIYARPKQRRPDDELDSGADLLTFGLDRLRRSPCLFPLPSSSVLLLKHPLSSSLIPCLSRSSVLHLSFQTLRFGPGQRRTERR